MAQKLLLAFVFSAVITSLFRQVSTNTLNDKEIFDVLLQRIDRLEDSDAANKHEIASLKSEMRNMKTKFLEKEKSLLSEINNLKTKLMDKDFHQDVNEITHGLPETPGKGDTENAVLSINNIKSFNNNALKRNKEAKRSAQVREAVELEVAFYATHTKHDVQHLGQNQIIIFDQAITNIGNAYNPHHGGFVTPVAGTYVFHVTMMGKDVHAVTSNHFSAHIDVDGVAYSQLWVEAYKQSSQMFVMQLDAGKTVSVKNHILDDGFVGQHMSTFSGFLLYQKFNSPAIVGK